MKFGYLAVVLVATLIAPAVASAHHGYDDFYKDRRVTVEGVLEDTPSSYPFNFSKRAFPFYFDVEQFRGGSGVNRVEVNLELLVEPTRSVKIVRRAYTVEAVLMDEIPRHGKDALAGLLPLAGGRDGVDGLAHGGGVY